MAAPKLRFYRTSPNLSRMPGGMLLGDEFKDTKAFGTVVGGRFG